MSFGSIRRVDRFDPHDVLFVSEQAKLPGQLLRGSGLRRGRNTGLGKRHATAVDSGLSVVRRGSEPMPNCLRAMGHDAPGISSLGFRV